MKNLVIIVTLLDAEKYEYGKGVKQSTYKAIYFYGKACDMRDSDGCAEYARLNRGRAAFNY